MVYPRDLISIGPSGLVPDDRDGREALDRLSLLHPYQARLEQETVRLGFSRAAEIP